MPKTAPARVSTKRNARVLSAASRAKRSSSAKRDSVSKAAVSAASPKEAASAKAKKELLVKEVRKRSGEIVAFDLDRVTDAVRKAMIATGEGSEAEAELVANQVYAELVRISKRYDNFLPTVEGIQDAV